MTCENVRQNINDLYKLAGRHLTQKALTYY